MRRVLRASTLSTRPFGRYRITRSKRREQASLAEASVGGRSAEAHATQLVAVCQGKKCSEALVNENVSSFARSLDVFIEALGNGKMRKRVSGRQGLANSRYAPASRAATIRAVLPLCGCQQQLCQPNIFNYVVLSPQQGAPIEI